MNGPSVHDRTSVAACVTTGRIIILNSQGVGKPCQAVHIPRERIRQLCLDLLDMEEYLERREQ